MHSVRAAHFSSRNRRGLSLGKVIGAIFGLFVLAALVLPAVKAARDAGALATNPAEWVLVETGYDGATVRMPLEPSDTTMPGPDGVPLTLRGVEMAAGAFMVSVEPYGDMAADEVRVFNAEAAQESADAVGQLMRDRMAAEGGQVTRVSTPGQMGDYWYFDIERDQMVGPTKLWYASRMILYPTGMITLQHGAKVANRELAEKFFGTFEAPPIAEVVDMDTIEPLEGGFEEEMEKDDLEL